ncbi:MAG: ABC transporter substrate-binding protein [Candidatus Shapirobacteria bacterium]
MFFVFRKTKIAVIFLQRNLFIFGVGIFLGIGFFLLRSQLEALLRNFLPSQVSVGILGKYRIGRLPKEVAELTSFGLTKLSTNNTPQKGAALSWEVKEQGKQYLFHLDPLLHWQDGSPLLSKDIQLDIEAASVEYPDGYSILVSIEKPFSPLPSLVANPLLKKGLIGLGDYQIEKVFSSAGYISYLSLKASRHGLDPKKITFRFYPDQESLVAAFKLGEVDCVRDLDSIELLRSWENLRITPVKESASRYVALFFNTRKEPFSDKSVRQALAYAFQKPEEGARAFGPISPLSWAYNPNVKTYPFDPDRARTLLKELELTSLELQVTTTYDLADWAEKIKDNWEKELGIKVNLLISPYISDKENFDIILGYGLIPSDPDQYPFWHSNEAGNITGFSNPRIDKLLEDGRATLNKDERKNIYHDFQRYLLEELPAIFLFHPTTYQICRPNAIELN